MRKRETESQREKEKKKNTRGSRQQIKQRRKNIPMAEQSHGLNSHRGLKSSFFGVQPSGSWWVWLYGRVGGIEAIDLVLASLTGGKY